MRKTMSYSSQYQSEGSARQLRSLVLFLAFWQDSHVKIQDNLCLPVYSSLVLSPHSSFSRNFPNTRPAFQRKIRKGNFKSLVADSRSANSGYNLETQFISRHTHQLIGLHTTRSICLIQQLSSLSFTMCMVRFCSCTYRTNCCKNPDPRTQRGLHTARSFTVNRPYITASLCAVFVSVNSGTQADVSSSSSTPNFFF